MLIVTQSCLTLWDPMDCSLLGSSVHGDSPGKNTGVGCYAGLYITYTKKKKKIAFVDYKLYIVVRTSYILNKCRYKCIKGNTERVTVIK